MTKVEAVQKYCRKNLSRERFEHLERVYETMQELNAKKALGLSEEKLALAGFGHDIARELPGEIAELLALSSGRKLEKWEHEFKLFCHNKAGIYILQKCFGVDDAEVFEAVEHHTLGNSGMCVLAKALYVADFLEPKRPFLNEEERQNYIAMPLDRIVYKVCLSTISFLEKNRRPVLPPTNAMLSELKLCLAD